MTALTNRGLALKLAVEHVTDSGAYDLMQSDDDLQSVFNLAEKFATWIGGQNAAPESGEQAATPEPAAPAERSATEAVDAILAGITANAAALGTDIVETAQREAGRLRNLGSFQAVTQRALDVINANANTLGATAADRLRRVVGDVR